MIHKLGSLIKIRLFLKLIILAGICFLGACTEKEPAEYSVNATIVPEDQDDTQTGTNDN